MRGLLLCAVLHLIQFSIANILIPKEEAYNSWTLIRPEKLVGLFPLDGVAENVAPLFDYSRYRLLLVCQICDYLFSNLA